MKLIDADKLKEHKFLTPDAEEAKKWLPAETKDYQLGWNDAIDAIVDNAPTIEYPEQITIKCDTEEAKQQLLSAFRNAKLNTLVEEDRPHGKWIEETDEHLKGMYRCSVCGRRVEDLTDDVKIHAGWEDCTVADIYPYCHCGSKMTGGEKWINHKLLLI